jgi:hypothetical protein
LASQPATAAKMPTFNPEMHTRCTRPVFTKSAYNFLSIFVLLPSTSASTRFDFSSLVNHSARRKRANSICLYANPDLCLLFIYRIESAVLTDAQRKMPLRVIYFFYVELGRGCRDQKNSSIYRTSGIYRRCLFLFVSAFM